MAIFVRKSFCHFMAIIQSAAGYRPVAIGFWNPAQVSAVKL
jgi:hypothetical protein